MKTTSPTFALVVAALSLLMPLMASAQAQGGEVPAANANSGETHDTTSGPTADASDTNGSNSKDVQQGSEPPSIYNLVRVTEVYNPQYIAKEEDKRSRWDGILKKRKAGLGDIIIIKVEHLEALLERAHCQKPYDQKPCREQEIALFLDGRKMRGLEPESGAPEFIKPTATQEAGDALRSGEHSDSTRKAEEPPRNGVLRYHLQRTGAAVDNEDDNKEYWADLLGLGFSGWKLTRPTDVSVGLADEYPVPTEVKVTAPKDQKFYLVRIRPYWLISWAIFTFACIYLLWRLATKSDVLRDRAPVLWGQSKPYSLSAFQAAWWFILVMISFIFIWLVTGQYDLSSTALVLLGIGLGTGLGATIIDSNKRSASRNDQVDASELNLLLYDKERLETELTNLRRSQSAAPGDFDQKKAEYDQKITTIRQKFPNAIGPAHESFHMDILSDASGVSFHRFQMLVWTIILGMFFVYSVLSKLAMPQFSETLLLLMGISAGTYLGFKIPENANMATPPATPPATGGGENVDDKKDDAQDPTSK